MASMWQTQAISRDDGNWILNGTKRWVTNGDRAGLIMVFAVTDGETNGNTYKGELCKHPMYDFKGEIVRGKNKDIPNKPNPWTGIKKK